MQKKYQPALRKGIKIAVDLVNSVKQDEKDGDVDIKVKIAPNDTEKKVTIVFEESKIDENPTKESNKTRYDNLKSKYLTLYQKHQNKKTNLGNIIGKIEQKIDSDDSRSINLINKKIGKLEDEFRLLNEELGPEEMKELDKVATTYATQIKEKNHISRAQ